MQSALHARPDASDRLWDRLQGRRKVRETVRRPARRPPSAVDHCGHHGRWRSCGILEAVAHTVPISAPRCGRQTTCVVVSPSRIWVLPVLLRRGTLMPQSSGSRGAPRRLLVDWNRRMAEAQRKRKVRLATQESRRKARRRDREVWLTHVQARNRARERARRAGMARKQAERQAKHARAMRRRRSRSD